jgi:hypothetical protein
MNAGVYRLSTRRLTVYLPVVLKAYTGQSLDSKVGTG